MSNTARKRSEYEYEFSEKHFKALLKIALKKDEPVEDLIVQALDQYIEREKKECQTT